MVANLNQIDLPVYEEVEKPQAVCQYGIPLKALLSNFSCIFGLQSGVAAINPNSTIRGVLQKRLPVSINWDRLPRELKDFFRGDEDEGEGSSENKGKEALIEWVEQRIEEYSLEDRSFQYGEEILGFHWEPEGSELWNLAVLFGVKETPKPFHYCILKNNKMNQPMIPRAVMGLKKTKEEEEMEDLRSDILKFNVVCDLDVTSQWWKLRGDGIKATTCPIELKFYEDFSSDKELDVEWDVMFGIESLKGGLAYLSAYVNSHGGGIVDVEEGTLTLHESGEVINLDESDADGPLQKWIRSNTQEVWVEFKMINAEFRSVLVKRNPDSIALDFKEVSDKTDLVLISIEEDYVLLRERIQVLAAA